MSQTIDKLLNALKLSEELVNMDCNVLADTIKLAEEVTKIVVEKREEIAATNINVIDAAARGNLRETGHSRVLYNLLKNKDICKSFLEKFLPGKVVGEINLDNKITEGVDREKQNIDISIFAKPYFIIIENKVKGAVEQPGQIYRYVQYGLKKTEIDKIYVLYLNKDNYDPPTDYSLNEEGKPTFSEAMMKEHIIPLSYKDDIYNWIEEVYENEKENRESHEILFSALVQYKDYLEDYFELSNKYKDMANKINECLVDRLSLNEEEENEQINILYKQFKNTTELTNRLGNFMISKLRKEFERKIRDKGVKLIQHNEILDYPILGIEFSIIDRDKQYKVQCAAEIEKKDGPKPFYGIRCHKKCEVYVVHNILEREDLTTDFPESDNYYPIWKYCDINDLVENTYNLALKIIAIANDPNSGFKL